MKTEYIFFKTDESFDYNGPFGTETHNCEGLHGFSIEFDKNDKPLIETIEGFGAMADVENCKTLNELNLWLEENKKYIQADEEIHTYSTEELIEELQSLIKNIQKGV